MYTIHELEIFVEWFDTLIDVGIEPNDEDCILYEKTKEIIKTKKEKNKVNEDNLSIVFNGKELKITSEGEN